MHTEEEARGKWCPEARGKWCPEARVAAGTQTKSGEGFNRVVDLENNRAEYNLSDARCIASECMHWRFERDEDGKYPVVPRGYCGLSGKP